MTVILDPLDPTRAIEDGRLVTLRCKCGRTDCGARLDVRDGQLVTTPGARFTVPWWAPYMVVVGGSSLALAGLVWWWWR